MYLKSKGFQLGVAAVIALVVALLPRPDGTRFRVSGDPDQRLLAAVSQDFTLAKSGAAEDGSYVVVVKVPGDWNGDASRFLRDQAVGLPGPGVRVSWVDGLSPEGKRFLAVLSAVLFLFVAEPIPLEITALLIGVLLAASGVTGTREARASYMNPVVAFIMCCLVFAIALDKSGLTRRLGFFIARRAGGTVVRFTFILTVSLGYCSIFLHDAAACAIGIMIMLPLMKAAGIRPHTNTARFMLLSLPFACSAGGMGSLIGGGRCMVSAAFLKELTGTELSFLDWMLYALPGALVSVPLAVLAVFLVFRPDPAIEFPAFDESAGAWTGIEKRTAAVLALVLAAWAATGLHGLHHSITGMAAVALLVLLDVLKWDDIHQNLEWGTALFVFGGGLALGLAMHGTGAGGYLANLLLPLFGKGGWLVLFAGVGIFGALAANAMANVAVAALVLPVAIPMAVATGVDPRIPALCLGMCMSFALLLATGSPGNAIACGYRYFTASDLTRAGAVATPVLLLAVALVAWLWWGMLGLT